MIQIVLLNADESRIPQKAKGTCGVSDATFILINSRTDILTKSDDETFNDPEINLETSQATSEMRSSVSAPTNIPDRSLSIANPLASKKSLYLKDPCGRHREYSIKSLSYNSSSNGICEASLALHQLGLLADRQ
jgi:hypothetical protein